MALTVSWGQLSLDYYAGGAEAVRIAANADHPYSLIGAGPRLGVLHLQKGESQGAITVLDRGVALNFNDTAPSPQPPRTWQSVCPERTTAGGSRRIVQAVDLFRSMDMRRWLPHAEDAGASHRLTIPTEAAHPD
jgi:hypothetical protein